MRARWRAERDRSSGLLLDLKQGAGTLLDIEFIVQTLVLLHAGSRPRLLDSSNTASLIAAAAASGALTQSDAASLAAAHAVLLERALACTLDARPRLVPRDDVLEACSADVLRVASALGLDFLRAAPQPASTAGTPDVRAR